MNEILQQLWKNWMFRLSLSSNELFHSNTLQYLAEAVTHNFDVPQPVAVGADTNDDVQPAAIMPDLEPQGIGPEAALRLAGLFTDDAELLADIEQRIARSRGGLRVLRESGDMDLKVVAANGKAIFGAELKVKSYPEPEQLQRYASAVRAQWQGEYSPPLFLLALVGGQQACTEALVLDAGAAPLLRIRSTSFGDLSARLGTFHQGEQMLPVQAEYIALCGNLAALAEILSDRLSPYLSLEQIEAVAAQLRPYRLHSMWHKLWSSYMASLLRAALPTHTGRIAVGSEFTSTALVDAYWLGQPSENRRLAVGVQLQGSTLRLFLSLQDPTPRIAANKRQAAERALLKLCAVHGLFRANPRYDQYASYWLRPAAFWNAEVLMPAGEPVPGPLGGGWPKSQSGQLPRLHGFKTGFADFRLKLGDIAGGEHSLQTLVALFSSILLANHYSAVAGTNQDQSILEEICASYQENPDTWVERYGPPPP